MKRWLVAALLLLLFQTLFPVFAQRGQQRRRSQFPDYYRAFQVREETGNLVKVVLKNGFSLLIEEFPADRLACILLFVKTGSSGAFGGEWEQLRTIWAEMVTAQSGEDLRKLGGISDAVMGADYVGVLSVVPDENVSKAFEIIARIFGCSFDPDQVRLRAESFQNSGFDRAVDPTAPFRQQMGSLLWGSPLPSAVPSGNLVSAEEVARFHRTYFNPGNVIVSIAGAARREQFLKKTVELFSGIRLAEGAQQVSLRKPRLAEGRNREFQYQFHRADLAGPVVLLGSRLPGPGAPDYLGTLLVEYLLFRGSANLVKTPVTEKAPDFGISGRSVPVSEGRTLALEVRASAAEVEGAEVALLGALEFLRSRKVPLSQLNRAKALCVTDHYNRLQRLDERALSLAWHDAVGDFKDRDQLPGLIAAISPEEVRRIVQTYFSEQALALIEVFPSGGGETRTFTPQTFREAMAILVPPYVKKLDDYFESLSRGSLEEKEFRSSQFQPGFQTVELKRTSILRGPEVFVDERHTLPLVELGFFYPGGRYLEDPAQVGITELMLHALLKALEQSQEAGLRQLEQLGVVTRPINDPDFFGFQATVPSASLNEALWVFVRWLRKPAFEPVHLEAARQELLSRDFAWDLDPVSFRARNRLFAGHPYGRTDAVDRHVLAGLSPEAVSSWLASQMGSVHPYIVVLGDVKGTSFLDEFVGDLGNSRYSVRPPPQETYEWPEGSESLVVEVGGSETVLAAPGFSEGTYSRKVLDVAAAVLGGAGGRLTERLVARKAGFLAELLQESRVAGGTVFVRVVTPSAKSEVAVETIRAELASLRSKPVAEDEFLDALVRTITLFLFHKQNRPEWVSAVMRRTLAGAGPDYEQKYLLDVRRMRLGEVEETMGRVFKEK